MPLHQHTLKNFYVYMELMLKLGKDEMAKYPFMPDAGRHLQEYGFELKQFGTDPVLNVVVKKAYDRVMTATKGSVYDTVLKDGEATDEILDMEIFSFLIAIVLIKLANRHTLVQRFALAEARRAESHLALDLSDKKDRSRAQMARRILYDVIHLDMKEHEYRYLVPVHEYLKHSAVFHEREWKLVNREVKGGSVILTIDKIVRLIRDALTTYIMSRITKSSSPGMIPGFEDLVSKLQAEADRLTPKYVMTGEYPPCIKHAISVLEDGKNLPHSGRFMLATFLLERGQTIEQIAPLFKNAPDYKEQITLYQLNHLAGNLGPTKYGCPSCDKLRIQDLCYATAECDGITIPTRFGRKKISNYTAGEPSPADQLPDQGGH